MSAPLLELRGIGKSFPGVTALDDVGLALAAGEVRALMGENGAGKSTLLKILAGDVAPDAGEILVAGEARRFASPADSAAAGISIIHQELHLVPDLSVEENLLLGRLPSRGGRLDRAALRREATAMLERLGEDIAPGRRVGELTLGRRQMVEIGKALLRRARIIAFDEPTSSLSSRETETLMRIIGDLRRDGHGILYVSHRLEEVFELCDSVSVLRDGRHVATHADLSAVGHERLIAEMAGREIADIYGHAPRPAGEVTVEIRGLSGPGVAGPVDLRARQGEILGLFGLVGAGRSELFRLIFGAARPDAGTIRVKGREVRFGGPRDAIAAGIGLCPEDRKDEGLLLDEAVRDNIVLARRNFAAGGPLLDRRGENARAGALSESLRIKTPSLGTAIRRLSGGNQQKALIARWMDAKSDILLLDEPTRGIDIGARSEIYQLLYRLAAEGRTILVASSDMAEIIGISDRIMVMREGRPAGELTRAEADPARLLRLAMPAASRGAA